MLASSGQIPRRDSGLFLLAQAVIESIETFKCDNVVFDESLETVLNWTNAEHEQGRRIVTLTKSKQNNCILVSLSNVYPQIQVSIIKFEGMFYVSSVDVILLYEFISDSLIDNQKRIRVRRILEEFKPLLCKKGTDFYRRVMEYSNPKPRKVEKSTKMFEWKYIVSILAKMDSYLGSSD